MLLPILRTTTEGKSEWEDALRRHVEPFNSHPYLVGLAAGAVTRMEEEGSDPETIRRFKEAIRAPLGSLGDRLVWVGILPSAALAALLYWMVGGRAWMIAGSFLVLYNIPTLWLRWWSVQVGLRDGSTVGRSLRYAGLGRGADRMAILGCLLLGAVSGVVLSGTLSMEVSAWFWSLFGVACLGVGMRIGARAIAPTRVTLLIVITACALLGLQ